jgi:transcriptional antiterminator NusG
MDEKNRNMTIFTVRTAIGREEQVVDFLATNAEKADGVHAILSAHGVVGYIFIEADSVTEVQQISYRVPYVRGVLTKAVTLESIDHLIEFKAENVDIQLGDTVEIIGGPFKGERGKVTRIKTEKSEVIVELLEAAVPIPITLNLDSVKVVGKENRNK